VRVYCPVLSAVVVLAFCAALPAAYAGSATVEIQGVSAADPGKQPQTVPTTLARYKAVLKGTVYGTFADAGSAIVKPALGGKDSAAIGAYGVDVALSKIAGQRAKVEVTIKQGGKPIGQPIGCMLSPGEPVMVSQLGDKQKPTILLFTLKETE